MFSFRGHVILWGLALFPVCLLRVEIIFPLLFVLFFVALPNFDVVFHANICGCILTTIFFVFIFYFIMIRPRSR